MDHMPRTLPIFPLTGALLLPGGRLPLFIFEPRYVAMIQDVLEGDRVIGMVQPVIARPGDDRGPEAGRESDAPEVYPIGCAGMIEHWEQLPREQSSSERYLILLHGHSRFRIHRELPARSGYRRAEVSYDEFAQDQGDSEAHFEPGPLLAALERFGQANNLSLQLDRLGEVSGLALLNSMAMALPFAPVEKQALLEAADVEKRQELLLTLLKMGLEIRSASGAFTH